MEDLTKLTLDEARKRLKQAGVGSIVKFVNSSEEFKIVSFKSIGDPCIQNLLTKNNIFVVPACTVILVKAINNTQAAVTHKFKKGDHVIITKGAYNNERGIINGRILYTHHPTIPIYSVKLDAGVIIVYEDGLQKALDYPPIGSRWASKNKNGTISVNIEVTAHDKDELGDSIPGTIQVKHLKNSMFDAGTLACLLLPNFYKTYCRKHFLEDCSTVSGNLPKQTNDGRATCYACGAPTKRIGCLPGSQMMVCTKCGL